MIPELILILIGSAWCLLIYQEMKARETQRRPRRVTQADLDAATATRLQGVMEREVEERLWSRQMDRQKWRVRYQEAAHHYNIRKWRVMWDGVIEGIAS